MSQKLFSIPKKPIGVHAPLSLAQRRLWFLYQLDPKSPEYNISRAWRLKGSLNTEALATSLNLILARHETLRTTFQEIDGQPIQVIQPTLIAPFQEKDCSSFSPAQLEAEIDRFLIDEPLQPFDLHTGPLLRFTLIRCSPDDHVLVFTVHHMVFDGTSLKNFCQELSLCYQATLNGHPIPLAPLPIQYQDFAYWQQHPGDDHFTTQLEYWQQQLHGAPLVLELPSDLTRPIEPTGIGQMQVFTIPPSVLLRLQHLIQPRGVTRFMALLAIFQILLARYTGQRDLLVGAPIAGRTHTDFEGLMGFFVNRLVLRGRFKGEPTFYDVLEQVRRTCLEAYSHQTLPFEKLVEALQPNRDSSRYPVVQAIFQFRHASDLQLSFPEILSQPFPVTKRTGNFDLHLVCEEKESAIQGLLYYPKNLFTEPMMAKFTQHYQNLVEGLIGFPRQSIWRVEFLIKGESHQQLCEWNDTTQTYSKERTIVELIEEQAAHTPDTVAVVYEEQFITFGQLNIRANQLAHHLRSLGVKPEVIVGLCVERSMEMIVGLLGILKAGGAYLPLEPTLPKDRLHYMIEAASASILLTQKSTIEKVAHLPQPVVCLDAVWPHLRHESQENPACQTLPGHLMYVLFTSGSTGEPKSVAIEHRQLVNYLYGIIDRLDLTLVAHFATVSPLSADLGHTVLFPSLCTGRTLHVIAEARITSSELLAEYFECHPPDCLKIVPSHLDALLTVSNPTSILPRKHLVLGGEPCGNSLLQKIRTLIPNVLVTNHYGPTETTVGVTTFELNHEHCQEESRDLPIGHPLPNVQVYILDSYLQPIPIGVMGELYVSGHGVARGYTTHSALTAERFIPNPFDKDPGVRMYRTGDLARYRADGTLEFRGRTDHQVKVRGYRIELGEIETVLRHHVDVRETVVMLREDRSGDKQLVAYVTCNPAATLTHDELRSFVKGQLPDYAMPRAIVTVDTLPLTSNGKVDRHGLPEPEWNSPPSSQAYVPPPTSVEATLIEIWQEVLRVDQIGIHDNFFELGGHSLLAIKLIARMKSCLNLDVRLRNIFDTPTVAGLATELAPERAESAEVATSSTAPIPHNTPLLLSYTQERFWLLEQLHPHSALYHSYLIFQLTGPLHILALTQSLQEIVNRHEILRTVFPCQDGVPIQVILPSQNFEVHLHECHDFSAPKYEHSLQQKIFETLQQPFNLPNGPLFRADLWKVGFDNHALLLTSHHIISDAWSKSVMLRELEILYDVFRSGKESPLTPLGSQYANFAIWQRKHVEGESGRCHLEYWKNQLRKPLPSLSLPTDFPRPAVQIQKGNLVSRTLPFSLSQKIKHICKEEHCTVFMILLTTLALLFHRYTGDKDIIIGAPSAGRSQQEWEGLIGCFLNTLALRIDLSGRLTFRQLLRRVREVTLNAQMHEEIPFEKLLEELKVERDLSCSPLFQVFLNMHEFSDDTFSLSGLKVTPFPKIHYRALFDLTLYFKEMDHCIHLALNYNVALFSQSRIEAILGQLQGILEEATASLDFPLRRYSLISSHSGHLLPDPQIPLHKPLQEHVLELIRQQAEALPGHTAIRHEGRTWSYQELINQAETIAKDLCVRGLQSGDVVAIAGMRSFGMIASLLGVLRAGGIIMPLDSQLPILRQRLMRQEGQAKRFLWIGEDGPQEFDEKMEPNIEIIIINPTNGDSFDRRPFLADSAVYSLPQLDDAAYMFFTSGTTGKPKGILGSHQALSHFLSWQRETFAISPDDRVAQCTGLSFDAVLRDIFLPLTSGATVCLPPGEAGSNELLTWLAEEQITVMHVVPSVASFWVASVSEPIYMPSLRWVFFAGEPLTDQLLVQWEKACPGPAQFVNLYGTTETTLVKSWYLVPAERMEGVQPIGRPIPQTQLLVMGEEHHLCGIGEVGELVIRTPFRSLGYLHTYDDTPRRFVPNPYREDPNDVIYLTGDLGRYRVDGTVDILGRRDDQVKIRGVRAEPQEVAAVLSTCPEVQMCAVLAGRDNQDEMALTAFVVAQPDTSLSGSAMRAYLSARIPSALVPSQYVRLDQLSLTPNGKINRQALRSLIPTEITKEPYVAPRTEIEKGLTQIWEKVLGQEHIGVHDNFFEMGGHSLLAMQVINRIQTTFHIPFPLQQIFATPTLAECARHIDSVSTKKEPSNMVRNHSLPRDREAGLI